MTGFKTINKKVTKALRKLRKKDSSLLEIDVNERTISHKLAEYLQEEFPKLHVDCEYNRHGGLTKLLDLPKDQINWDDIESKTVFPDIVIHKRKIDSRNLLVIEIKKSSNKVKREFDINKIIGLTINTYNYKFGLFVEFNVDDCGHSLKWYKKGKLFHEM